jgi:hypothetical protein
MRIMLFVVVSQLHFQLVKKIIDKPTTKNIIRIVNFDHFIEFGYFTTQHDFVF